MKTLLKKTDETPLVTIDENGVLTFSGKSLPEYAKYVYLPVIVEISELTKEAKLKEVVVEIDYFNTASKKVFLYIFKMLENIPDVKIVWRYKEDDEDIIELGETFFSGLNVNFVFQSLP